MANSGNVFPGFNNLSVLLLIEMSSVMNKVLRIMLASIGFVILPQVLAEPTQSWTLQTSVQRALEVMPEMKIIDAEIGKQQGELEQADAWPNPSVSLQMDDSLGLEDASGGYDFTELAISQPLPFGRLAHQREQAEAALASAKEKRRYQQLLLEHEVANRFHVYQLAEAKLQLAKKRLQQARHYKGHRSQRDSSDPLIRYLTPLEVLRLDIVLQAARQSLTMAEGEFNAVSQGFKALLGIAIDADIKLMSLNPVPAPDELSLLNEALKNHPLFEAGKQIVVSLRAGVDVARSQRFDDPTLTLFQGEDFLDNRRQTTSGFMLSVQLPLWNQNNGSVSRARHSLRQAQAELNLNQRDLYSALNESYLHLGYLIEQIEHFRNKLLQPAEKMFALTKKGFDAGELNVLTLIDANNTYFDSQERYFELLQEGWLEMAELRKSAGLSLLAYIPVTNSAEVK
jgi:cobalt-zinc-cadmium efflux system outer membrane protein